jgi:hypothetical protein
MATREEVVKLTIESAEAAKSVKEVRESLKAIRDQMMAVGDDSKEFHQLAAAAAELKDRVNDANEAMAAMHPDGFQAVTNFAAKASGAVQGVTGAMALFGGESEEVQKTMMKLQAAMALTQGLESLKDMSKAWRALNAVIAANPVLAIIAAVLALAAAAKAVYDWFVEQNSEAAKLEEQAKQIEAVESRKIQQLETQARILKAQGASEDEIYKNLLRQLDAKLKIAEASLIAARQRAREADFEEEEMAALAEASKAYEQLLADKGIAQIEYQNWQQEQRDKEIQAEADKNKKISDNYKERAKVEQEAIQQTHEVFMPIMQQQIAAQQEATDKLKIGVYDASADMEGAHKSFVDRLQYLQTGFNLRVELLNKKLGEGTVEQMGNMFGALSEASKKNAKMQKAFAIVQATINTYQAATKALASLSPPASYIAVAAALISGFAQVRNIAMQNVDNPSSSSAGGGGGGMGLATINSAPDVNTAQQPSTLINEQGQAMNQQQQAPVYVAVTEIREVSNNVNVVENLARF